MNWIDFKGLLAHLKSKFRLDWKGVHGLPHWSRVYVNAKLIAENERRLDDEVVIYPDVLKLFSFLHDHERNCDASDPDHGRRASASAADLRGKFFQISDEEMELLSYALIHHSNGAIDAPITVKICWDADRLDLGRVGTRPHPAYLCTETARSEKFLEKAYERSLK